MIFLWLMLRNIVFMRRETVTDVVEMDSYKVLSYAVLGIKKFAEAYDLSFIEAYRYLEIHGGLQFVIKHYEVEHTLSLDDAVEDMPDDLS
jgi:hypothetical protein